jgi:cytochrome c oxidase assembly factor CtaG
MISRVPAGAALTPVAALTTWQLVPLVSGPLALCAVLYLAGTRTAARRHPARPWPRARSAAFLAGLAAIASAICGSDGVYDDVLLRAHMVQHLLLIMVAPPLLVYGRPVTLLLHATRNPWHRRVIRVVRSRTVAALTWPPFCVALYSVVVLVTHLTPLLLATGWLHDGEHLAYLVAGYLFFLPVVGSEPARWRLPLFGRYLLLLAAMPTDIVTGAALMLARPFGGYGAADVHAAGVIMLAGSELIMTALAVLLAANVVRSPTPLRQAAGGLEAYNARLALLASGSSRRARDLGNLCRGTMINGCPAARGRATGYSSSLVKLRWVLTLRSRRRQQVVQRLGEVVKFREVSRGEVLHQPVAFLGEVHADHTGVVAVLLAADEAGGFCPVDQADRAVALQHQVLGKVPDGRGFWPGVPLDGHQQLVLGGRQAGCGCLFLAPAQESSQGHAEPQVVFEICAGRLNVTVLLSNSTLEQLMPGGTGIRCHLAGAGIDPRRGRTAVSCQKIRRA